jgi:hypothetical protein
MQDGDIITGEGDQNAPAVSDVAEQLAKQDLEGGASETASAIIERITTEVINDRKNCKKVAKTFLCQSKLAKAEKLGKGPQQKRTGADEGGGQGLREAPAENNPAADAVVAEDVEEHMGDADGKAKRKRGNRKRGRGGQGAKSGPDRQQAAPVAIQGRPSGAPRGIGQIQFPGTDNIPNLSLPREQRRAEVDQRLSAHNGTRPTCWDKPPAQAPRRSPPRRDTRRSPDCTLDNSRRRQLARHPPLIVASALTTPSFWASLLAPLSSSRSGFYISEKGIRIQLFVSLHRWSVACECHSPSVLCRWTEPLVDKPHDYRKAGSSPVMCPRIRSPQRL